MAFAVERGYALQKPPLGARLTAGHELAQGLVGCWLFNEGAGTVITDVSPSNNKLTMNGATPWVARGLTLLGASFLSMSANPIALQLATGTIGCWFKTGNAGSGFASLIVKQSAYSIFCNNNMLGTYSWGGGGSQFTTINVADNKWHQAVLAFSPTASRLYLDGVLVLSPTVGVLSQTNGLFVGAGNNGAGQNFNGLIDLPFVYNRVLSGGEVSSLYCAPYQMMAPPVSRFYSIPQLLVLLGTDNATSTDNALLTYNASFLDTGTGTDSVLTTALYAALDAGNLTDAAGLLVTIAGLESGGASESGGVVNSSQTLFGSDAGTWSDTVLLSVLLAIPDTAVETELNQLAALFTANDTGAGSDTFTRLGTLTIKTILTAIRKRLINVTSGHH